MEALIDRQRTGGCLSDRSWFMLFPSLPPEQQRENTTEDTSVFHSFSLRCKHVPPPSHSWVVIIGTEGEFNWLTVQISFVLCDLKRNPSSVFVFDEIGKPRIMSALWGVGKYETMCVYVGFWVVLN